MLHRVALVRTEVSGERAASIIRVTRIRQLGTTLAVASHKVFFRSVLQLLVNSNVLPSSPILLILMLEAINSSEMSVPTRATRRNIPKYGILHSHGREYPKSYIASTGWTL
jgi:hypothetical protein